MLDKFNEISMKLGEDYSDELMEQMTALQEQIDAANAWDIDSKIEMAMNALRCPDNDSDVTKLSGGEVRRVAICQLLLTIAATNPKPLGLWLQVSVAQLQQR